MSDEHNKNEVKLSERLNLREDFAPPTYESWREVVDKDLKGAPFEKKLVTKTYEGINLQPIYTRKDLENLPLTDETPGFSHYVRSSKASGYLGKAWDICQELPYGDAEEFNSALKNDLERGQTAINFQVDKATKLGLDADYAKVEQVGEGGLSISGLKSLTRSLDGINLNEYPVYLQAGFSSLPLLTVFNAYLKKNGYDIRNINGSLEADPVSYLASEGKLPIDVKSAFDEMAVVVKWAKENAPQLKTIGISGSAYNNAGASAVQELAFVMATAVEYLNQLTGRGISAEDAASQMRFTFGIGTFYFMEVAKLRAARVLWSNILGAYGVDKDKCTMTVHGKSSAFNQTMYDPYVNMLRTTTEAFSAVVGGVDSLHTNPFDETFGLPNRFSRRIARNTQIILNEESHLNQLIDPAGGSYFVENLTNEVAKEAWKLFQQIEDKGGMLKALEESYPQGLIEETNEKRKKDAAKRKSVIVGTNMYANITEEKLQPRSVDHENLYKKRADYLQKFRVAGDNSKHEAILEKLHKLADKNSEDAVNTGADAVLEGATLGEISKSLRAGLEESNEITPVKSFRISEMFEELRDTADIYKDKTGSLPKVFLANMGALKLHKGRADFSRGFFEVGGFEAEYPKGFETPEDAASAALESGAKVVVICSIDDNYPEIVPPLTKAIKDKDEDVSVVLAGYPKDQIEAHKEAGVDEFIFLGCDAYELLSKLLKKIGALK